ncbi:MAG: hypothetical protein GC202_10450 [Alphaproteobacteria bacterium]|nr:hypothetical protein [Alphaproteobacteria bacterium]
MIDTSPVTIRYADAAGLPSWKMALCGSTVRARTSASIAIGNPSIWICDAGPFAGIGIRLAIPPRLDPDMFSRNSAESLGNGIFTDFAYIDTVKNYATLSDASATPDDRPLRKATDANRDRKSRRWPVAKMAAVAAFAVVVNAGVWLGAWAFLAESRRHFEEQAVVTTRNLSAVTAEAIRGILMRMDLELTNTVEFLELEIADGRDIGTGRVRDHFQALNMRIPEADAFRVFDASGLFIAGPGTDADIGMDFSDREWFRRQKANNSDGLVVSEPLVGRLNRKRLVSLSRGFRYPDGSFAGVVSASLAVDTITDLFSRFETGPYGIVVLRTKDLELLTRWPKIDGPAGAYRNASVSPELRTLVDSDVTQAIFHSTRTADAVERTDALRRIDPGGFVLVVGLGSRDYLAPWAEERSRAFALCGVFTLLTMLGSIGIATLIVRADAAAHDLRDLGQRYLLEKFDAESASRSKTEFLANMSHELRTPLNAIVGFAEVLQRQLLGPIGKPKYVEYASDIVQSARHLHALLSSILDLSRMDIATYRPDFRACDLNDIVEFSILLVGDRAARKNIGISWTRAEPLPLQADEVALRQVVTNLLTNSIKYSSAGCHIRIAVRHPTAGAIEFAIADDGAGIDPENLKKIFQPFWREGGEATRRQEGVGLGLAICHHLIEMHGGTIRAESAPGKGTQMIVTLPIEQGEAIPHRAAS